MARPQRQPLDQDRNVIISVSSVDGVTPTPLEVNPSTGSLLVAGTFSSTPTSDVTPSTQNITIQDTSSTTATTNANSQSFRTGTPTVGSVATFALASWETVSIEVTGTWTGSFLIEGSFDNGTTYYQKAVKQIGTSYIANNFTANFAGTVNVATLTQIAVRSMSTMTGTATVTVRQSTNNNGIYIHNGINIQDPVIATNKLTIKSASTAPLATDPSAVVTLSPNSALPLPTGAATSANQTNGSQITQISANALVTSPLVGQSKIATTATAVQLNNGTSQVLINGIIITAFSGNVAPISLGGSGVNNTVGGTGNGYLLPAGASISFAIANTNDLYINGTSGDYVSWAGS